MIVIRRFTLPFACLLALVLSSPGCSKNEKKSASSGKGGSARGGSMSAAPGKADSPKAVFESFLAAIKMKDYQAAFSQVEPSECRRSALFLAVGPYLGLSQRVATGGSDAEKAKNKARLASLTAVLKRLKIDPREIARLPKTVESASQKLAALAAHLDGPKAMAVILGWMEKELGGGGAQPFEDGKLVDLKMGADGKSATASFIRGGSAGPQPVKFVKKDGRWYIILDTKGGDDMLSPPTVDD